MEAAIPAILLLLQVLTETFCSPCAPPRPIPITAPAAPADAEIQTP